MPEGSPVPQSQLCPCCWVTLTQLLPVEGLALEQVGCITCELVSPSLVPFSRSRKISHDTYSKFHKRKSWIFKKNFKRQPKNVFDILICQSFFKSSWKLHRKIGVQYFEACFLVRDFIYHVGVINSKREEGRGTASVVPIRWESFI